MPPYWEPLHASCVLTILLRLCSPVASQERPRLDTKAPQHQARERYFQRYRNVIAHVRVVNTAVVLTKENSSFIKRVKIRYLTLAIGVK